LKRILLTALCLAALAIGAPLVVAAPQGIGLTIRFYNQQIVYTDSKIPIKVEISNDSAQTYTFKLADRRVFNLDFDVRTLTNVRVDHASQFTIQRSSNQPVFFHDVSIGPGEQFAFIEDLSDYVKFKNPGVYVVQALFYPDLFTGTLADANVIKSNQLTLNVNPGSLQALQAVISEETGQVLKEEALPPDEVIAYMLHARQKSEWTKFFLYIDVKNLMLQQPAMQRRYVKASDQEQRNMVAEFRKELMQQTTDYDILMLPSDFTVQKTTYTPTEATVEVLEKFTYPNYTELRQYTYYLHRPDRIWLMYNYSVRNLGTQ